MTSVPSSSTTPPSSSDPSSSGGGSGPSSGGFAALRTHVVDGRTESRLETLRVADLTAGELVVRTRYAGINFKDCLALYGKAKIITSFPRVAGIELVGEVVESTDARFPVGRTVLVHGFQTGIAFDGGFAAYARVPADHAMALPDGLTARETAILGVPGFTAAMALERFEESGLTPASGPIAVSGATGAVGSLALGILAKAGYRSVAVTRRVDRGDALLAAGAVEVLDARIVADAQRPLERARFAAAIDNVGGPMLSWLLRSMQDGGAVASVGNAAGNQYDGSVLPFIMRRVTLFGIVRERAVAAAPASVGAARLGLETLADDVRSGRSRDRVVRPAGACDPAAGGRRGRSHARGVRIVVDDRCAAAVDDRAPRGGGPSTRTFGGRYDARPPFAPADSSMNDIPDPDRRRLLGSVLAATVAVPFAARADAPWPTARTLRFVVPFTPGGTTDYVTRLVAADVGKSLEQSVLIENRPGAGTVIGVEAVARAAPDGYDFVTVANSFAANQTLLRKLPYDTLRDLRPVALMGLSEHVLATHPGSGIRSVADLRDEAHRHPGAQSFASFGNGTSAHLAGEMLKQRMGIDLVHVPYKGQGPALADLLGGHVTMMFGNWPEFRSQIDAGKLVAIGMATARRSQYAPGIPTLAEQGVPVESNSWNGLLAPRGTPDAVVDRMNAAVNRALDAPAVVDAFHQGGIASLSGTPDRFAAFIRSEIAKYADVIRQAHIELEG